MAGFVAMMMTISAAADSPFATTVVDFSPAPGQRVNVWPFNDPSLAIGPPVGGGQYASDNSKVVTLGGFGGSITLKFDHTVMDDRANPHCLDAIVFGNACWAGGDPNRHWAECGVIEISRDVNGNGVADDPWYVIPGSHIAHPVAGQLRVQTWDDNIADPTYPPTPPPGNPYPNWIPPGYSGTWTTHGYLLLPASLFNVAVLENPNGPGATVEGVFGYADFNPVRILGDLDGDDIIDDPELTPEAFYTVPDDPLEVGITPGSGGGDAFDIAWAIDPATDQPANLDGFDFIRITTGVNYVTPLFGEISTEVGGAADVGSGRMGDGDWDGDLDRDDFVLFGGCMAGPSAAACPRGCRVMDFDTDKDVDLRDFAEWQIAFNGS